MPRYFIDTSDDRHFFRDEVGIERPSVEDARKAAIDALPDMARDELPDGDHRNFLALVRDEQGTILLQANLTLSVVWLTEDRNP